MANLHASCLLLVLCLIGLATQVRAAPAPAPGSAPAPGNPAPGDDADRVTLGPADRAVIVLPDAPSLTERFAAEELQQTVAKMIGVTWLIQSTQDPLPSGGVFVFHIGRTALNRPELERMGKAVAGDGADSFIIKITAQRAQLVGGGDRGTLYSVYHLLESWGCRWFSPGPLGEIIPRRESLSLSPGDQLHRPWFVQREIGGGVPPEGDMTAEQLVDWTAKNRLNRRFGLRDYQLRLAYPDQPDKQKLWQQRGGQINWQWIAHNFPFMFKDLDETFEKHPEYFALYKGRRVPLGTPERRYYGGGNLSLQNPDVVDHCAEFAIQWFNENPDGMVVPMWPNDGAIKWCESPESMALGGKNFTPGREGSMTRRMITFVNHVADKVRPVHPDRLILLPAYANYILPEPDMTIAPNVMVQYCYHGDYAHGPKQSPVNAEAARQMQVWGAQARGRFGVWEYFLIGDHRETQPVPVILPLVYRIRDTVKFLQSLDARFYFTQSNNVYMKYNPLVYWSLAKLLWDPSLDPDALIGDYCQHMYAGAGSVMTDYYQLVELACQASDWSPRVYSDVAVPSPKVFTPEVLEKMNELLTAAESLAASESQAVRDRLALAREAYEYTKANVSTRQLAGLASDVPFRLERHENDYLINADGPDVDPDRFADLVQNAIDTGHFDRGFQTVIFRSQKRKVPVVTMENSALKVAVVPELGGRIVRIVDKKTGWNFLKEQPGDDTLASIGADYFHYGGYEAYIGKAFASPGWEQPFTCEPLDADPGRGLVLTTTTDEFSLRREVTFSDTDDRTVLLHSTLTNITSEPRTIVLRTHPLFDLGSGSGDFELFARMEDGSMWTTTLSEQHDGLARQPAGWWGVVNPEKHRKLVHRFDPAQAKAYVFNDDAGRFFQLELFSHETTLKPGESLTVDQSFTVQDGAVEPVAGARPDHGIDKSDPIKPMANPPKAGQVRTVEPTEGQVESVEGQVGQAGRFDPRVGAALMYPVSHIRPEAGTIEMWVMLPVGAGQADQAFLLGVGQNNPKWLNLSIHAGELGFLFKAGRAPYAEPGEFYASLSVTLDDWSAQSWHHVAVTWADVGAGRSMVRLYVDGKLRHARDDLTLGGTFDAEQLVVGRSSASAKRFLDGAIDELCISNVPRTSAEIAQRFQRGRHGGALPVDAMTTLLVNFDHDPRKGEQCRGRYAVVGPAERRVIEQRVQAIRREKPLADEER